MKKLLMPFLWMIFLFPTLGWSQQYFDWGNISESQKNDLLKKNPHLADGTFTQKDLDLVIKQVVDEQFAESAEITSYSTPDGFTYFQLNLTKIQKIHKVQFVGHQANSTSDFEAFFPYNPGHAYSAELVSKGVEGMKSWLNENGFHRANVESRVFEREDDSMEIIFDIQEGPQTKMVDIEIRCANPDLRKELQKLMKSRINTPFNDYAMTEIGKDLKSYFNQKHYFKADILQTEVLYPKTESEVKLILDIENPYHYSVEFTGLNSLNQEALEEAIEIDSFFTTSENAGQDLAVRTKNYYLLNGYAKVDVDGREVPGAKPFDRVIKLKILEGSKIRINKYEWSGKFTSDPRIYTQFIEEHSSRLIEKGYYNKDDLEMGLKNLISHLQNQGYLKAQIPQTRTQYSKDNSSLKVFIQLEEGPLTMLEKLQVKGNLKISEVEILAAIPLKPGQPLRLNQIQESLLSIKSLYRSLGYLDVKILNEKENLVSYNMDNTLAHIEILIQEGPQVHVQQILVEGNTLTKESVIRKELEFSEGHILTPALMDESQQRLQRLGHFDSIDIKTLEEGTMISQRTVLVRVTEHLPGIFNFGAGLSNDRGLTSRGYIGGAYRNIQGTGRALSARIEGNYYITDLKFPEAVLTIGYLEPYIFNTRTKGRIHLVQSQSVSDFTKKQIQDLRQMSYSVEQFITSHILASWEILSISSIRDYVLDSNDPADRRTLDIASTGPSLELSFLDNTFNPTKGSFAKISAEYSDPGLGSTGYIQYWKASASISHFIPFQNTRFIWANTLKYGYIENLKSDGGVPYDKKGFMLGGQSTIRGFEPGESFPNANDLGTNYLLTTKSNMQLWRSELQIPVYGNLKFTVFYDTGRVSIDSSSFDDGFRSAVGGGLRYTSPFGPLNLQFGYKLPRHTERSESTYAFHFSIGSF